MVVEELNELFDLDQDRAAFVAVGKCVSLQDIVEDELIVAIPMVPKHRNGCAGYGTRFADGNDSKGGFRRSCPRGYLSAIQRFGVKI